MLEDTAINLERSEDSAKVHTLQALSYASGPSSFCLVCLVTAQMLALRCVRYSEPKAAVQSIVLPI